MCNFCTCTIVEYIENNKTWLLIECITPTSCKLVNYVCERRASAIEPPQWVKIFIKLQLHFEMHFKIWILLG